MLEWQPGHVGTKAGSFVQAEDVDRVKHAKLDDPELPDHVITKDYGDQILKGESQRRHVRFTRWVSGTQAGHSFRAELPVNQG